MGVSLKPWADKLKAIDGDKLSSLLLEQLAESVIYVSSLLQQPRWAISHHWQIAVNDLQDTDQPILSWDDSVIINVCAIIAQANRLLKIENKSLTTLDLTGPRPVLELRNAVLELLSNEQRILLYSRALFVLRQRNVTPLQAKNCDQSIDRTPWYVRRGEASDADIQVLQNLLAAQGYQAIEIYAWLDDPNILGINAPQDGSQDWGNGFALRIR